MKTLAHIAIFAAAMASPAFAQVTPASPSVSLADAARSGADTRKAAEGDKFSLGVIDKLTVNRSAERPTTALAPIGSEQVEFAWRPGGKWGITVDMTSRAQNEVLPQEEFSAGAYYQVTPRFRFGGGLTLNGDNLKKPADAFDSKKSETEAGVRIESAFQF
jgi:hypothetical protein